MNRVVLALAAAGVTLVLGTATAFAVIPPEPSQKPCLMAPAAFGGADESTS